MKRTFIILLTLLLIAGCGPEPPGLKQTASSLKAGMTKREVKAFFLDYRLIANMNKTGQIEVKNRDESRETKQTRTIEITKLYNPSGSYNSRLTYLPNGMGSYLETCDVFFDTNNVIVGYYYYICGQW